MTFALPEIEKADCKSFTACGRVVTRAKSFRKLFSGERSFIASMKQGRSQRFVRLGLGETGHLHFDIATRANFQGPRKPKPTHTWSHIQSLLGRIAGQKIQARAIGVFTLLLEKLPQSSFMRMLSVESKSPKVSMKLTGGTFSVSGTAIQRLSWFLEDDGKGIVITLRATVKATVNETYFVDLFKLLNESFKALVLGDEK